MSDYHEHLELMNVRLRVMEVHLADIRQTLMDIRDAVLILGGSSSAPMPEDHPWPALLPGYTEVPDTHPSRQDGPVLRVAGTDPDPSELPDDDLPGMWSKSDFLGGQEDDEQHRARISERVMHMATCEHNWPAELTPDSKCEDCAMPYGVWSMGMNQ